MESVLAVLNKRYLFNVVFLASKTSYLLQTYRLLIIKFDTFPESQIVRMSIRIMNFILIRLKLYNFFHCFNKESQDLSIEKWDMNFLKWFSVHFG